MIAPTTLFGALVDDAAVFPPGDAPLPRAVAEHREHRGAWYSPFVGPLLLPSADAARAVDLFGGAPLDAVVVARPGTPADEVSAAVATAAGSPLRVRGVEMGWQEDWRDLDLAGLPLVLEIPRGPDRDRALADVRGGRQEGRPVLAKLRTGVTPTWAWPDESELARFVLDAARLDVPFKVTGGLHHVVRAEHDGQPQHGLLNLLVAVDVALETSAAPHGGQTVERLAAVLDERDAHVLAAEVAGWSEERAARVRRSLTAYGCCGVTEPLTELSDLALVPGAP